MKPEFFESSVDNLSALLEKGVRASSRAVRRFIDPMQGTHQRNSPRLQAAFWSTKDEYG